MKSLAKTMKCGFALLVAGLAIHMAYALAEDTTPAGMRGAAYLAPFKQKLKRELQDGLAHGPFTAIDACKVEAPKIADSLSHDGVRLGRTSHLLRNPDNTAPNWVEPFLDAYLADENNRAPRVVSLPDDREGYIEPIMLQPLCLACHGESLAKDVESQIDTLYPQDEARGFKVGDLRGVFWVEYPVASAAH